MLFKNELINEIVNEVRLSDGTKKSSQTWEWETIVIKRDTSCNIHAGQSDQRDFKGRIAGKL